ncbi:MAG TPA: hypothetical protein VF867_03145 [Arthrobacter sp.]
MSTNFSEANVTRNAGGEFTGHIAKEPGFSLEGLTRHQPGPSHEVSRSAAKRSRDQGTAAASLLEAYPDVVAARFVDIGSKDLVAPNGMTMPNPDYDPQPGNNPHSFRRFELRDVLLADGTVGNKDNQPRFTSQPGVEKLADNFQDHADLVFDPQDFQENYVDELFKDHVNNQHVYFHQLVKDAAPRELVADKWGDYVDTDNGQTVTDATDAEKAALGDRTPQVALQEHADVLVQEHGRKEALRRLSLEIAAGPSHSSQLGELWLTVSASKDRSLLSRMFRR